MVEVIGRELGFSIAGSAGVQENADPQEPPPKKNPSAYGVRFTPI